MTEARQSYIPQIPVPQQCLGGWSEGFTSLLDRRAWLEVLDPQHRYAKNLRAYFQAWDLMGKPGDSFLDWLDAGDFELDSCPRQVLNGDRVHYCSSFAERQTYALSVVSGRIRHRTTQKLVDTGPSGWIFVLRGGLLYANQKKTESPRFHHSSFFAGECVEVAGVLVIEDGFLRRVYPHSGHYRPNDKQLHQLLLFIRDCCIDLSTVEVDAQHTMKVARLLAREGNRVRKQDSPHFMWGDSLLNFLVMKTAAWSTPLFQELMVVNMERSRRSMGACPDEGSSSAENAHAAGGATWVRHGFGRAPSTNALDCLASSLVDTLSLREPLDDQLGAATSGGAISIPPAKPGRNRSHDEFLDTDGTSSTKSWGSTSSQSPVFTTGLDLATSSVQLNHVRGV